MSEMTDDADPSPDTARDLLLRKAAREAEATTYFTGIPCCWGHVAPRYTGNGECSQCKRMRTARKCETAGRAYNPKTVSKLQRNTHRFYGAAVGGQSW